MKPIEIDLDELKRIMPLSGKDIKDTETETRDLRPSPIEMEAEIVDEGKIALEKLKANKIAMKDEIKEIEKEKSQLSVILLN